MPGGVADPDGGGCASGFDEYGFQKLPPVTSINVVGQETRVDGADPRQAGRCDGRRVIKRQGGGRGDQQDGYQRAAKGCGKVVEHAKTLAGFGCHVSP
jgi:hypothetical protein